MRVILIALVFCIAAPAWADSDASFHVDLGSSSSHYSYDMDWYWGDTALTGGLCYYQNGLTVIGSDGDWGAYYSSGRPYYYHGYPYGCAQPVPYANPQARRGYEPLVTPYESLVTRYESLVTPYESQVTPYESQIGVPYNDRGGYRVFIPRGRGGQPELYGDYVTGGYQPGAPTNTPYTSWGHNRYHRGYNYGRPVVYQYSLGYPYYTAPAYPELNYPGYQTYDPRSVDSRMYGQNTPDGPQINANEVNVYEGDVYYYGGTEQPAVAPQVAPPVQSEPAPQQIEAEAGLAPMGLRFYNRAILELPEALWTFQLDSGQLTAGLESGAVAQIASDVHPATGVFASYVPSDGISLIFRQGSQFVASYLSPTGDWWLEPLPYVVNFNENNSVGMVGGVPWVAFSAADGTRYVFSFVGGQWAEVGSGTTNP